MKKLILIVAIANGFSMALADTPPAERLTCKVDIVKNIPLKDSVLRGMVQAVQVVKDLKLAYKGENQMKMAEYGIEYNDLGIKFSATHSKEIFIRNSDDSYEDVKITIEDSEKDISVYTGRAFELGVHAGKVPFLTYHKNVDGIKHYVYLNCELSAE